MNEMHHEIADILKQIAELIIYGPVRAQRSRLKEQQYSKILYGTIDSRSSESVIHTPWDIN